MTRTGTSRWFWFASAAAIVTVFAVALFLQPDPNGHGTHTQLGLPPCGFFLLTGHPCPGCGLTTSFAHMIRAQLISGVRANPFGVALFLSLAAILPLSIVAWLKRWSIQDTVLRFQIDRWALMLAIMAVASWVGRLVGRV